MTKDDAEEVESLEGQVAQAMVERLPQLQHLLVRPFTVELQASEVWVVAQAGEAVLFISLEAEQFGVGFLAKDGLFNTHLYASAELASQAFEVAAAHGA